MAGRTSRYVAGVPVSGFGLNDARLACAPDGTVVRTKVRNAGRRAGDEGQGRAMAGRGRLAVGGGRPGSGLALGATTFDTARTRSLRN